ncbi:helix-turn-helix transcriptional regulator [Kitasatospora sp. NPDC094015]|uniref:helix-turn-helix domain-containing protein n=1 Tax=Kitasatospora sp. NPDC094015 TaxID=3155205 RepID=UPI00331B634B
MSVHETTVQDALSLLRTAAGRIGLLSHRQREVLALLLGDLSNRQVAERLSITERTAKAHVAALMERLGVDSRLQLAQVALVDRLAVPSGAPVRELSPRTMSPTLDAA